MSKFFEELKRRNIIKETIAYLVVAWLILQVAAVILPIWNSPSWVLQIITITLGLGLPLWIIFSWRYQFTTSGIKKTKNLDNKTKSSKLNRVLNAVIMFALATTIALIWIIPSSVTSVSADKLSIAVLPFTNMSDDKSNDWFSIGVTEDILTNLSKVKGLRVISRTSVMQFKNSNKSIPKIAKELDVAYIVEGSVRKQDDKVLVTAQLINAEDTHLWADNYNENLDDVFKIQQEVSKKIVKQLQIIISPEEEEALSSSSTTNREAYQLFLRGRTLADTRKDEDLKKSITYYEQAISLDPNYADAYAEIANSIFLIWGSQLVTKNKELAKCRDYINKALAINPNTVRAYTVKAQLYKIENNWELAKENFEKAVAINSNDATAHHHFAIYYRDKPQPDAQKELEHISKAQQLDPLSFPINALNIGTLMRNERFDEAEELLNKKEYILGLIPTTIHRSILNSIKKKDLGEYINVYKEALKKEPENAQLHTMLAFGYSAILKDYDNAIKHYKMSFDLSPDRWRANDYFYVLIYNKNYVKAKNLLEDAKFKSLFSNPDINYYWYEFYAYKGEYEKAQDYLKQYKVYDSLGYNSEKMWLLSFRGRKDKVLEMLKTKNNTTSEFTKALIFANLKMKDSMYYYIDKYTYRNNLSGDLRRAMSINENPEVDSYRKDPRYIEFLKQNYFPVDKQKN